MRKMIYTDTYGHKHNVVFMGIAHFNSTQAYATIALNDGSGSVFYKDVLIDSLQFTPEDFNKFFTR